MVMYSCKFHQDKERKVVTRNFEFMVEKLWPIENSVVAHYWAMAQRLKTSVLGTGLNATTFQEICLSINSRLFSSSRI